MLFAGDTSVLRPPSGAKVAIFEFEDLQCPDCARAEPVVKQAVNTYKIPWLRHDFPLPMHNWSFQAAVWTRWFDANKSKAMGDELREFIYQNQASINPDNLRQYIDEFAAEKKVELPFAPDPSGVLAEKINSDKALGQRVGIQHTPTIYVVSNTKIGTPFVEVVDRSKLYELIDQMKQQATEEPSPAATKKTGSDKKKPPAKKT